MRDPNYNVKYKIAEQYPVETSLKLFEKMCLVRYFELGLIDAINLNMTEYLVYLSTGQEAVTSALSFLMQDYMIFAQHRAHDVYLTFGGDPKMLRDELLRLPTGTSEGKGGSNCLQYHHNGISMFGHHGLIGENVPQAVGAALGSGRKTVCFFGDGAAEEDYVLAAMGFAATHKLPVLFVCIDNDLSILTKKNVRRSWEITDVAKSFGMSAIDVVDDPWSIMHYADELTKNLPVLINCIVCRNYWHVGIGIDDVPEWDRFSIVRSKLEMLGLEDRAIQTEEEVRLSMEKLWNRKLLLKQ